MVEETEHMDFEGCNVNIIRNNGKVAVGIQHSKPMALIALSGFIHILGEPTGHCVEEGEEYVLFLFNDKQEESSLAKRWREVFS